MNETSTDLVAPQDFPATAVTSPIAVFLSPMERPKSVGTAVALTVWFGPIGSFYAGAMWGLAWLTVSVVAAVFTMGISILFTWPAVVIATAVRVSGRNRRVAQHRPIYAAATARPSVSAITS
jgi:hypothetical protein